MANLDKAQILATGVGSLPHPQADVACELIFACLKDHIPFWPQLPQVSFRENMYIQFSEGFPGRVIEEDKRSMFIDTNSSRFMGELEACYGHFLDMDAGYFAISQGYAGGLYDFFDRINAGQYGWLKAQVTGPVSFGLGVTDQKRQPIIYNPELREALVKHLLMKAKWQIGEIKKRAPASRVMMFIDEPYLVSVGSSFVNLEKVAIIKMINNLVAAIHESEAMAGIHCCGNTDWSILLETDIDILNFDAYSHLTHFLLYPEGLEAFLNRGGILALGIVPSSPEVMSKAREELVQRLAALKEYICDQLLLLVTPSCGCGSLKVEEAQKAISLAREVAELLQERCKD